MGQRYIELFQEYKGGKDMLKSLQNLQLNKEKATSDVGQQQKFLKLNKGQQTLSEQQQLLLLETIERLLRANFDPRRGSLCIVRAWADGTFEKVLEGNLIHGKAAHCHTQKQKYDRQGRLITVNDMCCSSMQLVGHEVLEALQCDNPGSTYYKKLGHGGGCLYAQNGHYVLFLPLDNGRIVASFRADYNRKHRSVYSAICSSVNEQWQHELMLLSLAKTLSAIMPHDLQLVESYDEIASGYRHNELPGFCANSSLIDRCLSRRLRKTYHVVVKPHNSKLSTVHQSYTAVHHVATALYA